MVVSCKLVQCHRHQNDERTHVPNANVRTHLNVVFLTIENNENRFETLRFTEKTIHHFSFLVYTLCTPQLIFNVPQHSALTIRTLFYYYGMANDGGMGIFSFCVLYCFCAVLLVLLACVETKGRTVNVFCLMFNNKIMLPFL